MSQFTSKEYVLHLLLLIIFVSHFKISKGNFHNNNYLGA